MICRGSRIDAASAAEDVPPLEDPNYFNLDCVVWWARPSTDSLLVVLRLKHYRQLPHCACTNLGRSKQTPVFSCTLSQLWLRDVTCAAQSSFLSGDLRLSRKPIWSHCASSDWQNYCQDSKRSRVEPPREIKSFPYFMVGTLRLTSEPAHSCVR